MVIKQRNIARYGYPPVHCDAEGDKHKEETED